MQDHCLVRSSMRHATDSCRLQRPARTNDIAQEGSMTMHVLDRPGIARRVAKTFVGHRRGGRRSGWHGRVCSPGWRQTDQPAAPTYNVVTILSGKSLHHLYTKAGSSKVWHSEPLADPDDITRIGGDLFTALPERRGPAGAGQHGREPRQHDRRVHPVRRGREPVGSPRQVRRPDRQPAPPGWSWPRSTRMRTPASTPSTHSPTRSCTTPTTNRCRTRAAPTPSPSITA